MTEPEWYKPAEIAAKLRLSRMTVYRMLAGGEIPSIRVRKSFRVPAATFNAWLVEQQIAPAVHAPEADQ